MQAVAGASLNPSSIAVAGGHSPALSSESGGASANVCGSFLRQMRQHWMERREMAELKKNLLAALCSTQAVSL